MTTDYRTYELVYILNPELRDEDLEAANQRVHQSIDRNDGRVVFENHWGYRKLAYPIAKKNQGYYVLLHLDVDPENVASIERLLNLDENVMRYLVTRDSGDHSTATTTSQ